MWRTALFSSIRLAANRPRTPNLCGTFFSTSSSCSTFWSTASSHPLPAGVNPPGTPFSKVRDEGPAVTDARSLMMSVVKPEVRSGANEIDRSVLKVRETSEIVDLRHGEGKLTKRQIGKNLSRRDKIKFLLDLLSELKDSKEAVYGALDTWVAWERDFPVAAIRIALTILEKDEQWHRIVQVIKWMLSKGQGNTMGTYKQLIRALEKDHRPEEAHNIWIRKFSYGMHSAPWTVCSLMISIYYRNNMLERLVKLFKSLEAFGRKPPKKSIVCKVADAYEVQGLLDEKHKVMEKYSYLFNKPTRKFSSKSQKNSTEATHYSKAGEC